MGVTCRKIKKSFSFLLTIPKRSARINNRCAAKEKEYISSFGSQFDSKKKIENMKKTA